MVVSVLDVVMHYLPLLTLLVAAGVAVVGLNTFRLRVKVDHADQWWKRAQYALDLSRSADEQMRRTSVELLQAIVPEELPTVGDRKQRRAARKANKKMWKIRDQEASVIRNVLNDLTVDDLRMPEDFLLSQDPGEGSMEEPDEGEVRG
ncbi:hypothetical protein OK351_13620 [Glutamicibacter sp. MNS18]|uniref:hypothetical protein n=1 Tax=Glutamicibacter sp. MNS18 TaxID=2989817 RepID=UPI002236B585|nr:hypothetical protein [Glutamicibacter sp. MNS18]MCW4466532.1 hypothetical protein [Glutamicibacter sp. MNS18]